MAKKNVEAKNLKANKIKTKKTPARSALKPKARRRQVAALPVRDNASGSPEVLIVTSRETGRFIILKRWTMKGCSDPEGGRQGSP